MDGLSLTALLKALPELGSVVLLVVFAVLMMSRDNSSETRHAQQVARLDAQLTAKDARIADLERQLDDERRRRRAAEDQLNGTEPGT